jgi:hypothetical protein
LQKSNDDNPQLDVQVVQDTTPLDIAALPLWQRSYLGAISAGLSERQALATAGNVSQDTINRYCETSPAFGDARAQVLNSVAVITRDELRSRAVAYSSVVIDDAFSESRNPDLRPGDRLGNRKFLGEAAGIIGGTGRGTSGGVTLNAAAIIVLLQEQRGSL